MDAGWYADPSDSSSQRYWDGSIWTEHVAPFVEAEPTGLPVVAEHPYQGGWQQPPAGSPGAVQGYGYAPGPGGMVVAPKNPAVSLIVSFFIPGVGSIINGDSATGVIILVSWLASWVIAWVLTIILIGFLLMVVPLGLWIYGMVHAYQGAVRWNAAHGVVS